MGKLYLDKDERILWSEYRHILMLSWPFEKYTLTNKRLFVEKGVLRYTCDEIKLFRINDLTLTKGILERILNYGSITIISTDKTIPKIRIGSIPNSDQCRQLISEAVERKKAAMGGIYYNQS